MICFSYIGNQNVTYCYVADVSFVYQTMMKIMSNYTQTLGLTCQMEFCSCDKQRCMLCKMIRYRVLTQCWWKVCISLTYIDIMIKLLMNACGQSHWKHWQCCIYGKWQDTMQILCPLSSLGHHFRHNISHDTLLPGYLPTVTNPFVATMPFNAPHPAPISLYDT